MSWKKDSALGKIHRQQQGCLYLWCIAHRLELAVLDTVKHNDYLSEFEDIINNIFLMYYYLPSYNKSLGFWVNS